MMIHFYITTETIKDFMLVDRVKFNVIHTKYVINHFNIHIKMLHEKKNLESNTMKQLAAIYLINKYLNRSSFFIVNKRNNITI